MWLNDFLARKQKKNSFVHFTIVTFHHTILQIQYCKYRSTTWMQHFSIPLPYRTQNDTSFTTTTSASSTTVTTFIIIAVSTSITIKDFYRQAIQLSVFFTNNESVRSSNYLNWPLLINVTFSHTLSPHPLLTYSHFIHHRNQTPASSFNPFSSKCVIIFYWLLSSIVLQNERGHVW